jgi:hypothetical protein
MRLCNPIDSDNGNAHPNPFPNLDKDPDWIGESNLQLDLLFDRNTDILGFFHRMQYLLGLTHGDDHMVSISDCIRNCLSILYEFSPCI